MGKNQKNSDNSSVYELLHVNNVVQLSPHQALDIMGGLNDKLQSELMRNNEALNGFIVAIKDVKVLATKGRIMYESPEIHVPISYSALLFNPLEGDSLVGIVNAVSMEHIGLLVDGFFNASIFDPSLRNEFAFDENNCHWVSHSDPNVIIAEGTCVRFFVQYLNKAKRMLSITGSLAKPQNQPE